MDIGILYLLSALQSYKTVSTIIFQQTNFVYLTIFGSLIILIPYRRKVMSLFLLLSYNEQPRMVIITAFNDW